ncbi:hypothetical protein TNCT_585031 [Trichonephila clavata]|uniref:Uncharacterized protein n=1 Tax=Trichonephila clavata TaxID=2740835 RepID=A0A8X6GLG3_TRICU|nr:hypothetical protein TNCT_585031 [Trichonephila clavata]
MSSTMLNEKKIEDNDERFASPEKKDMNADKIPQTKLGKTESDGESLFKDDFDLWGGSLILQFAVISACSIGYLAYKNDFFNLQLHIPDNAFTFTILLILVSIFVLGGSYVYAQLMSEKFLRITLRNKLAAAQTEVFIKSMRSANEDMAELSLVKLDEQIRIFVAKNEDSLRLRSSETDQKIRNLASENDQRIRLLAAITDERIGHLTPENNEYTKLLPTKYIWDNNASTENKNAESDSPKTDSTTVGEELMEEPDLNISKDSRALSESIVKFLLESDDVSEVNETGDCSVER